MAWKILRAIFGGFFVIMGLAAIGSLFGLTAPPDQPTRAAQDFTDALTASGFMDPLLGASFVAGGAFLQVKRTVPLGLAVLAPSVAVILFFHLLLSGQFVWGAVVSGLYAALAWHYRDGFAPLWSYRR